MNSDIPGKLLVEMIEPEKLAYELRGAESVTVEAADGELTFLPGHTSLLALLRVGRCVAREGRGGRTFAVAGGMVEVKKNRIRILTRAAEEGGDIDRERASRSKLRAEKRLAKKREGLDVPRAEAALARALNRLRLAEDRSERGYS